MGSLKAVRKAKVLVARTKAKAKEVEKAKDGTVKIGRAKAKDTKERMTKVAKARLKVLLRADWTLMCAAIAAVEGTGRMSVGCLRCKVVCSKWPMMVRSQACLLLQRRVFRRPQLARELPLSGVDR